MRIRKSLIASVLVTLALALGLGGLDHARKAYAQGSPGVLYSPLVGTEQWSLGYPCTVSCYTLSSNIASYVRGTALLYTTIASSADGSTTGEQVLASYSLPGGTLNTGDKLRIMAAFSTGTDGNNKTMKCYFGATSISSGAVSDSAKGAICQMMVTRTSANHQVVYATMQHDTTMITPVTSTATETDSAAITIKATGTNGTAQLGDIVLVDFSVELLGA